MIGTLAGPARRTTASLVVLVVAAVGALTLYSERPPRAVPASAPAPEFSAQRALGPLWEIATEPRPVGSAASDRARDHLAGVLGSAGFSVQIHRGVGAISAAGYTEFGRVENIVATLPGRNPTGSVVLAAHYDSVAGGPGASDDAAAIAAMLETVRALRSDSPDGSGRLRNNLVLLLTDGEEEGLLGASLFAREHPLARSHAVVLNWEARGTSGPSLMFETSRDNAALVDLFAAAAAQPHGDSSLVEIYRLLPNNTDFTEFAGAGLPGMNFAYVQGAAYYHTAGDTVGNLDPASLQHHGTTMLALTRALGGADLAELGADHDSVYFRFLGPMLTYPDDLVWPLVLLAALALVTLVVAARRRRLLSIPRLLLGALSVSGALIAAAGLAQGLWWVLLAVRADYAENPFLYRPQLVQCAVAGLAAFALIGWYLLVRRRLGPAALACAGLVWLVVLGALAAWSAPGAAHLCTLPALGGAVAGLLAVLLRRRPGWAALAMTAGVVPATVLLMPLAVGAFDVAGLALGGVAAAALVLFGFTVLPIIELLLPPPEHPLGGRRAVAIPAAVLLLVVALTGTGLAVDRVDAAHPRRTDLAYQLDADTGRARWVSGDAEPAAWTRGYVRNRAADPAGLADGPVWLGPAPAMPAAAPQVRLRYRHGDTMTLHVWSPRSAGTVVLRAGHQVEQVTVAVPGLPPVTRTVEGSRPGRWPSEIRVADLPAAGVDITLRLPHQGELPVSCYDQTYGLSGVPGFLPRPPGLAPPGGHHGDTVTVLRTYLF
ncbi:MAG: M28 family peptidase [Pseudonocardiaceae bacterium]